jgi:hypothetical protein
MHSELRQTPLQLSFRRKTKQNTRGLDASIRLDIKHMYCTRKHKCEMQSKKRKNPSMKYQAACSEFEPTIHEINLCRFRFYMLSKTVY